MSLAEAVARVEGAIYPTLEAVVRAAPVDLRDLLSGITAVQCSAEQFEREAKQLSAEEAKVLLIATLHRSLAHSVEIMPIAQARELTTQFIAAAGADARYFSNCDVTDELNGVGGWRFMVTSYTFESVLYCITQEECALLVAVDED